VTDIASDRADDDDFDILKQSKDHITHFALSIRPINDCWPVQYESSVIEIDFPLTQSPIALVVVPRKISNMREESARVFFDHVRRSGEKR
jgi:hypothetical protein